MKAVRRNGRGRAARLFGPLTVTIAALACGLPSTASPQPPVAPDGGTARVPPIALTPGTPAATGQPTAALPPERSQRLVALLGEVSEDNLMTHVTALAAMHTRHVNSQTIDDAALVIGEAFAAAGGGWQLAYDPFPLAFNGVQTTQRNVIATLPGSDPAAGVFVVGAHYDSRTVELTDAAGRAPGADDNASGVAVLLEMARLLAESTPRATVVLVAFSAEEVGKVGSTHFVENTLQRGDAIQAMLALDIVGNAVGAEGQGAIRVFSAPPDDTPSQALARFVAIQARAYLPGLEVQVQPTIDRPGRYSDHVPFSDTGIPSARLIEALEDTASQHSSFDTPGRVSPAYLRQSTQLALASVFNLAYGPPAPGLPGLVSGDTVAWQPVEGAAGYAVALRREGALDMDTLVRVGDVTGLTWDGFASGTYRYASLAAVDADGLMSAFSPELDLGPASN